MAASWAVGTLARRPSSATAALSLLPAPILSFRENCQRLPDLMLLLESSIPPTSSPENPCPVSQLWFPVPRLDWRTQGATFQQFRCLKQLPWAGSVNCAFLRQEGAQEKKAFTGTESRDLKFLSQEILKASYDSYTSFLTSGSYFFLYPIILRKEWSRVCHNTILENEKNDYAQLWGTGWDMK